MNKKLQTGEGWSGAALAVGEHIRQGDVLLCRVADIPDGAKPVALDKGRVVLAYGEVTGHAHAIDVDALTPEALLFDNAGEFFLRADGQVVLRHDEHREHVLPPGNYKRAFQVEYTPAELRTVAD